MTEDRQELVIALNRFSEKADSLLRTGTMNSAKIEVNAGGVGIWIATTACLMMLAVNIILIVLFVVQDAKNDKVQDTQNSKIDKMQDYLNAIYMQAPHLKPKEK